MLDFLYRFEWTRTRAHYEPDLRDAKLWAFSPLTRLHPAGYGGQAPALSPLRGLRGEGARFMGPICVRELI